VNVTGQGNVPASQIPVLIVAALMVMFGHSLGLHSAFRTRLYVPPFGYCHIGMSLFLTLGGFLITHSYGSIGSLKAAGA
jgi:peptidoglycan/LPS O-acetylase OafA/YrhL